MKTISRNIGVALFVAAGAACASQPEASTSTGGTSGAGKAATAPAPAAREYTVPEGTRLSLTLGTALDSNTNKVGDTVNATLAAAVLVGDAEVLPAGSAVSGTITAVEGSGRVKGKASMTLQFTTVAAAGRTDRYDIAATYSETAAATKAEDATKIGVGAGAGAVIGAVLGGKGGAAKGAVIGGGAGTGVVLATKGKEVKHAAGATLTATLTHSVDVKVPIKG